ncbi:MAG TPA: alkaline phosphatase family protein [Jatrophihabitans sp.]|nr:alkaline phosphatase family protein [Jatrophihabitans sp.]
MAISRSAEAWLVRRFYRGSDDMFARQRPDPSQPPGTDRLPQIKHIVLLMMENHSFDNYLGTLGHGRGLPVDDTGSPLPVRQCDGTMAKLVRADSTRQVEGAPTPAWLSSHVQYADGTNGGFQKAVRDLVPDATDEQIAAPMRYWTEEHLPFYAALARTFPLADHWFSSCLGPTFPNRRFLLAGTADGLVDDLPFGMVGYPKAGTILDLLTRNGIDWANYHAVAKRRVVRPFGRRTLTAARRVTGVLDRAVPARLGSPVRRLSFTADLYPLGMFTAWGHLHGHDRFFADARRGTLPPVSIVDPDFRDFSEEPPQDIARGEQFAAQVIDAVMRGPAWRDTLLIWFYDEHGGYYDSVVPPPAVEPDDKPGKSLAGLPAPARALLRKVVKTKMHATVDANTDMRYDRLGFRVPAVIVSPYARPGAVVSDVFDHTSVLRLIEDKWNLPSLTRRDAAANSPISALDLDAAPAFANPPDLPPPLLGLP